MGAIGIALNGVQFYGGAVERTDDDDPGCELLDVSSAASGWASTFAAATRAARTASTRTTTTSRRAASWTRRARARGANHRETTSVSHSPQIGWALGRLPVYGPRGANGTEMEHAANGCVGSHCLDFCSGREEALPGVDDFLYRYYVTGPASDLYSLPSDPKPPASDYPFTFRCYRGCVWSDLVSETNRCTRGSAGVADDYVPARPPATRTSTSRGGDGLLASRCADRGGECYASNHTCEAGRGGVFLANLCGDGAADADEPCGCCVRMPSAAPTWARAAASAALADDEDPGTAGFNSLYVILVLTFMSLVIFSLAAVGKFQYDKLKALEHKTERHRMSTRTRTEMVAAPAVV
ncbi:hypothetical protein SO694_001110102 [Aureococcus anophagefferens]|uniref:Uncharacterized protein n=1 Tax=Aureococcus anophagefferens TaxID=44056 RepID=A0ABR1FWU2_AURAN